MHCCTRPGRWCPGASQDRSGLGARGALHADHDLGGGVAPAAHLVRGVDAEAHGVVGEDEYVVDVPGAALFGQPLEGLDRVRLVARGVGVRRGTGRVAEQLAVEGLLEAGEEVDLVPSGRREDGAVLGPGDVPLQPLEDQHALVVGAGLEDLPVLLRGTELGVADVAVLGEDHPVETELLPGRRELGEGVLGVVAVHGVVVMVADQIDQVRGVPVAMPVSVSVSVGAASPAVGQRGQRQRGGGEGRAEQTRAAHQSSAAEALGVERLRGNLGVGPFGYGVGHDASFSFVRGGDVPGPEHGAATSTIA